MENVEAIDKMVHLALISSIHWGKNEVVGKKKKTLCLHTPKDKNMLELLKHFAGTFH